MEGEDKYEMVEDPFSMETGESSSRLDSAPNFIEGYAAVDDDHHSVVDIELLQSQHGIPSDELQHALSSSLSSDHSASSSNGRRRIPPSSSPAISAPISGNPPQSSVPARRHPLTATAPTTTDNPGQYSAPARRPSKMSKRSFHGFLAFVIIFLFVLWWFFPSEKLEVKDGRMMNVNKAELPFSLNITRLDLERLAMLAVVHPSNTSV